MNKEQIKAKLEELRKAIEDENISYGEIAELQSLAEHIDKDDMLLRQWAGIPEDGTTYARKCDMTGEGMNDGFVFGDGSFYAKDKEHAEIECKNDEEPILESLKNCKRGDEYEFEDAPDSEDEIAEFESILSKINNGGDLTGSDLRVLGYYTGYLYYTEWECEDDMQYIIKDGKLVDFEPEEEESDLDKELVLKARALVEAINKNTICLWKPDLSESVDCILISPEHIKESEDDEKGEDFDGVSTELNELENLLKKI